MMESKKEVWLDKFIKNPKNRGYFKRRMEEQIKNAEMILMGNTLEAIIPAEVKVWGSSAHIPFQKKFIGKKVKVYILREEDQPKES